MPRAKEPAEDSSPSPKTRRKRTRGSGAATVYEQLRSDILSLRLEPGTLLDETELAARFRLSRSPVREALIRLAAEGLVQTLRNRSSVVAPFDLGTVPSYLDAIELMYRLTARLAALNRRAADLAAIQQLQKEHSAAVKRRDTLETIRLNYAFHEAIGKAGGNAFYLAWLRNLLDQGQRIIGLYLHDVGEHLDSHENSEHGPIVRAIERQDADAAEEAARRDAAIISERLNERFRWRPSSKLALAPEGRRGAAR
jgi:DNA-binding GntR family transcriptional regulator